jgi:hypothetical protein
VTVYLCPPIRATEVAGNGWPEDSVKRNRAACELKSVLFVAVVISVTAAKQYQALIGTIEASTAPGAHHWGATSSSSFRLSW